MITRRPLFSLLYYTLLTSLIFNYHHLISLSSITHQGLSLISINENMMLWQSHSTFKFLVALKIYFLAFNPLKIGLFGQNYSRYWLLVLCLVPISYDRCFCELSGLHYLRSECPRSYDWIWWSVSWSHCFQVFLVLHFYVFLGNHI